MTKTGDGTLDEHLVRYLLFNSVKFTVELPKQYLKKN